MKPFLPLCSAFVALAALLLPAAPAWAQQPDEAALQKPVRAWVDAFNRWDFAYPQDAFEEDAVVIDQFPPFLWQGNASARQWWTALMGETMAEHERRSISKQRLELGPMQFVQSDGLTANFVQPATLTWTAKGQSHEMKALWVATERKAGSSWRISSHAWAPLGETVK